MKRKGHKHKESFSILLISNTGRRNREVHISRNALRFIIVLLLCIVVALGGTGWLFYYFTPNNDGQGNLQTQLDEQVQLVAQLEAENQVLSETNQTLEKENEELRQSAESGEQVSVEEAKDEEDLSIPRLYPSSSSAVISFYTEEQPYLSINTHKE